MVSVIRSRALPRRRFSNALISSACRPGTGPVGGPDRHLAEGEQPGYVREAHRQLTVFEHAQGDRVDARLKHD